MAAGTASFESHRPELLALAYRMLGDLGRAEDVVQDTWVRWSSRRVEVENPRAYLAKTATRLCLNDLTSARARREIRADRLPEPIDLSVDPLGRLARLEDLSLAVLVALQRLTAAERAALLLHDVFELSHSEIAALIEKSEAASRQLVRRAREQLKAEKRALTTSDAEHRRLLEAFTEAARSGDAQRLAALLADDVVLVADAGSDGGRFGGARNLPGPLVGRAKVAAFTAAVSPLGSIGIESRERSLNGRPALVLFRDEMPFAVLALSVADGLIRRIFIQNDRTKLGRLS